jgi:hypothetical protein
MNTATNANANRISRGHVRISPLRASDTPEGSRVIITSDGVLNDYTAYRSGDRYYVVIPQAEAPAQGGLSGRGFTDAQVTQRGDDVVISFRLLPGTRARVNQQFNRLEIVFNSGN